MVSPINSRIAPASASGAGENFDLADHRRRQIKVICDCMLSEIDAGEDARSLVAFYAPLFAKLAAEWSEGSR